MGDPLNTLRTVVQYTTDYGILRNILVLLRNALRNAFLRREDDAPPRRRCWRQQSTKMPVGMSGSQRGQREQQPARACGKTLLTHRVAAQLQSLRPLRSLAAPPSPAPNDSQHVHFVFVSAAPQNSQWVHVVLVSVGDLQRSQMLTPQHQCSWS